LYLVTGKKWTVAELKKAGARIHNTAKLFNIKHGWKKKDDYPPWRAFNEYLKDKPVLRAIKDEHKHLLKSYQKLHGIKKFPAPVFDEKGAIIKKEEYEEALLSYYKARGWDENGIPFKKTLRELKIK